MNDLVTLSPDAQPSFGSTRHFGSVSEPRPPNGCSPWVRPFPPRLPPRVASPCSVASQVSPTPGGASLPVSLSLIGSLTWFKTRTPTGLLGSRMNLPYRAASKHLGAMGE